MLSNDAGWVDKNSDGSWLVEGCIVVSHSSCTPSAGCSSEVNEWNYDPLLSKSSGIKFWVGSCEWLGLGLDVGTIERVGWIIDGRIELDRKLNWEVLTIREFDWEAGCEGFAWEEGYCTCLPKDFLDLNILVRHLKSL